MEQLTSVERALLQRCARYLEEEAQIIAASNEPWRSDDRALKRRHDNMLRDARDLRSVVKRSKNSPALAITEAPASNG